MSRLEIIPTSTLRAMAVALRRRPWNRLLRRFLYDVENELLARDLPAIADETGGHPVARVVGWQ